MKIQHDKVPLEEFQPGTHYTVALRGTDLYRAEVVKFQGGCWATVRVVEAINPETSKHYPADATFDIKVAEYDISPA